MITKVAKGHGGQRVFYDRTRRSRKYNVFCLSRIVDKEGSAWRLIIGPLCFAWGYKPRKSER